MCAGRGRLGFPCLAGDTCTDFSAECVNGVCICGETFYERDGACYERGRYGTPCLPRGSYQLCVDPYTTCNTAGMPIK